MAAFLPPAPPERDKEPFSTSSLFERDGIGHTLQLMYSILKTICYIYYVSAFVCVDVCRHVVNVNMNLHLWLGCYWGVGEREGDAGGFRSEDVTFSHLCWRRCDFLAHMLVDDLTSSWERTQ